MNFVAIVGTNASFSYNRKLLWYMKRHFGKAANLEILEIADIPLFSEDIKEPPLRVRELAHAIEMADGVIFSTPEYDHSITASLKSLIEWLSWGDLHPLMNTPVMIVGVSLGNMGTVFAQENLRQILSSPGLDAFVLPGNQFLLGRAAQSFDENENLTDARTVGWLEHCFDSFMTYAQTLKPLRHQGENRGTGGKTFEAAKSYLEQGNGWAIEDISLFPMAAKTDSDTGSSKRGEGRAETATGAISLGPSEGLALIEAGDGWWIEKISLNDTTIGSSSHGKDAETGASQREESKVALGPSGHVLEKGQPDTSTGASQH